MALEFYSQLQTYSQCLAWRFKSLGSACIREYSSLRYTDLTLTHPIHNQLLVNWVIFYAWAEIHGYRVMAILDQPTILNKHHWLILKRNLCLTFLICIIHLDHFLYPYQLFEIVKAIQELGEVSKTFYGPLKALISHNFMCPIHWPAWISLQLSDIVNVHMAQKILWGTICPDAFWSFFEIDKNLQPS